jgi:predicted ester cyclase
LERLAGLQERLQIAQEELPMSVDENKQLSRRLYEEVFGRSNLTAADEIMAEDCVRHGPGTPPNRSTDQIKRQAILLRTAMPDLQSTLHNHLAEGDQVASYRIGRGTFSGPLNLPTGPVAPTGASIAFDEIRIDRCVGGRIVESWFIPDRLTVWEQLGLIRPGPQASTA